MSGSSSSSINTPTTGDVNGIPKICDFCRHGVTLRVSKSEGNPHRAYFRCDFAHAMKLKNDKHLFKWFDVAVVEEAGLMSQRFEDFHKDIRDLLLLMKDTNDKSEEAVMVAKECKMLKLMLWIVIAIVVFFGLSNVV